MKKLIVAIIAAIGLASAALLYTPAPAERRFQGWVEADFLFIGADEPGRLKQLTVAEGDLIDTGTPLFAMESDLQKADRAAAQAAMSAAKAALARAEGARQRPQEIAVLQAQEARVLAAFDASDKELIRVQTLAEKGIATTARLDQARAARQANEASLAEVRRQIAVAGLAARQEDIEAAKQRLREAEARLAGAETRLAQRRVASPTDARVQSLYYRPGEIVPAGRPVLSLLPPERVKIRFFVPEPQLASIAIGAKLHVACDGCAAMRSATVTFIAEEAEFTPPVIYSLEERAKLVFRVEATPETPSEFRIGQPVSVLMAGASL